MIADYRVEIAEQAAHLAAGANWSKMDKMVYSICGPDAEYVTNVGFDRAEQDGLNHPMILRWTLLI